MKLPPVAAFALAVALAPFAHARQDTASASYRIRPHDILNIRAEDYETYSEQFEVDARGKVSMPFVGDVDAAGKTADELAADLTEALKKIVREPRVRVRVVGARRSKCRNG